MTRDPNESIHSVAVIGRRWFQRTYGNTFHTVEVAVNGRTVYRSPRTYGYEDHYQQTALEWLQANGYVDPRYRSLREWATAEGIDLTVSVADVARRRDL